MLMTRELPPLTFQVGDATVTYGRNTASTIVQRAIDFVKTAIKAIPKSDVPNDLVEDCHQPLDVALTLPEQLQSTIDDLKSAAAALRGGVVRSTGPLVELSVATGAMAQTMKLIDAELDPGEPASVAAILEAAAEQLEGELRTVKSRIVRLDVACRRASLLAMTNKLCDISDLRMKYELPTDFELPDIPERKSIHDPMPDQQQIYRQAARDYFNSEKTLQDVEKRQRKAAARREAQKAVTDLWERALA
jgi:predicted Zn-dependent protease with MMP-like domain